MNLSSAYLLVFHGSRDSRTKLAVSHLTELLAQSLENKSILTQRKYLEQHLSVLKSKGMKTLEPTTAPKIGTAALELATLSLHQSAIEFSLQARKNGDRIIKVIPLFLSPGVHVREDIPSEIALAQKEVGNQIYFKLSPYIGKYSGMVGLLANKFARLQGDGRILCAHGSRFPQANVRCETIAAELDALPAYWASTNNGLTLDRQIARLISQGKQKIAVVPYFLFPGRITSAIATQIAELQATYPQVELMLDRPLGATWELADLIRQEVAV